MRSYVPAAFLFITFISIGVFGQTTANFSHKVSGTVKDPQSAVIGGLRLCFQQGEKISCSATDVNGAFSVDLSEGDYIVTIDPVSLYDFRAFLKITANGPNPSELEWTVDPTGVCCPDSPANQAPKPLSLPKPPYPAAARAVRANGEVVVQLKIDREGKVISGFAISGHPLLRAAALAAGRRSEFEPDPNVSERPMNLSYIFLMDVEPAPNVKRYSNPYRIEVIAESLPIDY